MVKRTGPTNLNLRSLNSDLDDLSRKENVKIWRRISKDLSRSTRIRRGVNLTRINRYCKDNDIIVVPGKVLGGGELDKKVTVAAWNFSDKARESINKKGKAMTIRQLMKENPKGKKVRIIG